MRRAKGAGARDAAAFQCAGDARHHRHFQRFGGREFRQDAGQARRHQRFAGARRADHDQIVAAGRRDLDRALGGLLALDLSQVGAVHGVIGKAGLGRRQQRLAAQMVEQCQQIGGGDHFDIAGPGRFPALRCGADQAQLPLRCVQRREQHARGSGDAAVQPQFADDNIVAERLGIEDAHRRQQSQRDRQIVMRAFLGQVGRREIDRDMLGRQRQAQRGDGAAHPLAALRHGLVGQADHDEFWEARRQLDLNFDGARFQPQIRGRRHDCDHVFPPDQADSRSSPRLSRAALARAGGTPHLRHREGSPRFRAASRLSGNGLDHGAGDHADGRCIAGTGRHLHFRRWPGAVVEELELGEAAVQALQQAVSQTRAADRPGPAPAQRAPWPGPSGATETTGAWTEGEGALLC